VGLVGGPEHHGQGLTDGLQNLVAMIREQVEASALERGMQTPIFMTLVLGAFILPAIGIIVGGQLAQLRTGERIAAAHGPLQRRPHPRRLLLDIAFASPQLGDLGVLASPPRGPGPSRCRHLSYARMSVNMP
jgi:hypothetical protein